MGHRAVALQITDAWTTVVVPRKLTLLPDPQYNAPLFDWLMESDGLWSSRVIESRDGYAFLFENPHTAFAFKLRWL